MRKLRPLILAGSLLLLLLGAGWLLLRDDESPASGPGVLPHAEETPTTGTGTATALADGAALETEQFSPQLRSANPEAFDWRRFRIVKRDGSPAARAYVRVDQGKVQRADPNGVYVWMQEAAPQLIAVLSSDGQEQGLFRKIPKDEMTHRLVLEVSGRLKIHGRNPQGAPPAGLRIFVAGLNAQVKAEAAHFTELVAAEARSRGLDVKPVSERKKPSNLSITLGEDGLAEVALPWTPQMIVQPLPMKWSIQGHQPIISEAKGSFVEVSFEATRHGFVGGPLAGLTKDHLPGRVVLWMKKAGGKWKQSLPQRTVEPPQWKTQPLVPGHYEFLVRVHPKKGRILMSRPIEVEVRGGDQREDLAVTLFPAPTLSLEVESDRGQPLASAEYAVAAGDQGIVIRQGPRTLVHWGLPGTKAVVITAKGYTPSRLEGIEVGFAQEVKRRVRLHKGLTLNGVVLGPSGTPVPRTEIHVADANGRVARLGSDASGRFSSAGWEPGLLTVTATFREDPLRPSLRGVAKVQLPRDELQLRLEARHQVTGIVRLGTATMSGLTVRCVELATGRTLGSARTNAAGRYRLWIAESGTMELVVEGDAKLHKPHRFKIEPDDIVIAANLNAIRVR